jgi:hypothetical protein
MAFVLSFLHFHFHHFYTSQLFPICRIYKVRCDSCRRKSYSVICIEKNACLIDYFIWKSNSLQLSRRTVCRVYFHTAYCITGIIAPTLLAYRLWITQACCKAWFKIQTFPSRNNYNLLIENSTNFINS